MSLHPPFSGAKIALLHDDRILIYQRDDKPGIPWPGLWDLPGGGRENAETPWECALRESHEEFGISLQQGWLVWEKVYPGQARNGLDTWFLVAHVPAGLFEQIVFGDEGQRWEISTISGFLQREDAIGHLQQRLREYLQRDKD